MTTLSKVQQNIIGDYRADVRSRLDLRDNIFLLEMIEGAFVKDWTGEGSYNFSVLLISVVH